MIEDILGEGGFGITYRASESALKRPVAIKELFPTAQGCVRRGTTVQPSGKLKQADLEAERAKFLEEGQRLAQFQHPGIVKVFSLFEENNTAYMVMELLKGKTLQSLIDGKGPLQESQALRLLEQVAEALDYVHKANVIHRDIKPDNVIVTDEGRAVLLDFGTAREFAFGQTRRMTALLTPGYAPLEQYGQQARFDRTTDIYALGATFYHVLTGQLPVLATDRAAGVDLSPPHKLNSTVSRQVSDAIMWAMEMRLASRPKSAQDLVQALKGKASPQQDDRRSGSTSAQDVTSAPTPNPYEARIRQLMQELEAPPSLRTPLDGKINQLHSALNHATSVLSTYDVDNCPSCRAPRLMRITGRASSQCPICRQQALRMQKVDSKLCPICQRGHLHPEDLPSARIFCPICRSRSLKEEKRKRFGLALDLWWVCPGCRSELDVLVGGRAKLVSVGVDPFGVGQAHIGQTHDIASWQAIAPLSNRLWSCDDCSAHLYEFAGNRLCLDDPGTSGKEAATAYLGKTYFRTMWVKLANGIPPAVGIARCPGCESSFDYDDVAKALKVVKWDATRYPDVAIMKDGLRSLEEWAIFAAGKRSIVKGRLCESCYTEFDDDGAHAKLVRGFPKLHSDVGKSRSLQDWFMLGQDLPSIQEQERMRAELASLSDQQQKQIERIKQSESANKDRIRSSIRSLAKTAILEGYVPKDLDHVSINLRKDETVLWESPALKLKRRSANGVEFWDSDGEGVLVLTKQRILFQGTVGVLWWKPVEKILMATMQLVGDAKVVALALESQQKPVGFAVPDTTFRATINDRSFTIPLDGADLAAMISKHCMG